MFLRGTLIRFPCVRPNKVISGIAVQDGAVIRASGFFRQLLGVCCMVTTIWITLLHCCGPSVIISSLLHKLLYVLRPDETFQ